jgi:hypothetical protein
MRDIRRDLQERADLIEEQIRAAHAYFEKMVQQLQSERDAKVSELKSWLVGIAKVMEAENHHKDDVLTLTTPQASPPFSLAERIRKVQ